MGRKIPVKQDILEHRFRGVKHEHCAGGSLLVPVVGPVWP